MNRKTKSDPLYVDGCIRTYTGKYVSFARPLSSQICIEDIAHALSRIPRFLGHTGPMMSVAQHCVEAFYLAPNTPKRIKFLLHDAHEAYSGDIPSPLRPFVPGLKEVQNRLDMAICKKFGLSYPLTDPEIKDIDKKLVEADWERFMVCTKGASVPLSSPDAEKTFLKCYEEYCEKYGFR